MLIKDIPNIKEILNKVLTDLENKEIITTVYNPNSVNPDEIKVLKDTVIENNGLTIELTEYENKYDMIIYYNEEQVNYHTENEEIRDLLKQIEVEFLKKC